MVSVAAQSQANQFLISFRQYFFNSVGKIVRVTITAGWVAIGDDDQEFILGRLLAQAFRGFQETRAVVVTTGAVMPTRIIAVDFSG